MVNSKHAFWQALVFTVIVFGMGVLIGFSLEGYRFDKSQLNLINSEINILDEQVRNRIVEDFNVSCELAKESLFVFADDVYQEALQLEDYDSASKFTNSLFVLHKRYDLLRTILWAEAVKLKKDTVMVINITCGKVVFPVLILNPGIDGSCERRVF